MKIYRESLEKMIKITTEYTSQTTDMEIEKRVYDIIQDVIANGDSALRAYAEKFDRVTVDNLKIDQGDIDAAYEAISPELKAALLKAKDNITEFEIKFKDVVL